MANTVSIREATYVDPRAGHDKFYRVYALGERWVAQYGRNNTLGTFTKVAVAANPEAAVKAADAKLAAKIKKGYQPGRAGTVTVIGTDLADTSALDAAAAALPENGDQAADAPVIEPAPFVAAADSGLNDRTANVVAALDAASFAADPAQLADTAPPLPMRPMLASVPDARTVADAMKSDDWVAQFKYDGDRVVIEVIDGQIRVLNRQGQPKTRNVGQPHLLPFTALHSGRWVFDGEIVGRTLVLFDVAAGTDGNRTWVRDQTPFLTRYRVLAALAAVLNIPDTDTTAETDAVRLAPIALTHDAKANFLTTAVNDQREGIILRRSNGEYEPGRRSTTVVKHKLVKDADVIVTALHPAKQSAELSVHDRHSNLVQVGSASTIGKDAVAGPGGVSVGQVWTVTFLYVTDPEHPRMMQPRLVACRDDKSPQECLLAQFADAGTNKTV